jgi:hypothetical protein
MNGYKPKVFDVTLPAGSTKKIKGAEIKAVIRETPPHG